jgi:hypothetical protein
VANTVPDRGDNPKRRVKYSDMNVSRVHPSGAYEISHMSNTHRESGIYMGYTKKEAMKKHKDKYEGN